MTVTLVADRSTEAEATRVASPLAVRGLTVSYGQTPAIFSVDMTVRAGAMTAIVGPNGAGKSTLLKAALQVVKPLAGTVTVFGKPLAQMRDRIAYVPQRASVDWDFPTRVIDVVLMGMYRQLGLLGRVRAKHRAQAMDALSRVGMTDFATRQIGQLSGGQQQRVFLEKAIIAVLQDLRDTGRTVLAVHHDLVTVPDYFDDVVLLNTQVIAAGPVETVFTEANLQAAYGGRLTTARVDPESAAG
jgi:manganese/zinc/iron transport system ATP- binding protein